MYGFEAKFERELRYRSHRSAELSLAISVSVLFLHVLVQQLRPRTKAGLVSLVIVRVAGESSSRFALSATLSFQVDCSHRDSIVCGVNILGSRRIFFVCLGPLRVAARERKRHE